MSYDAFGHLVSQGTQPLQEEESNRYYSVQPVQKPKQPPQEVPKSGHEEQFNNLMTYSFGAFISWMFLNYPAKMYLFLLKIGIPIGFVKSIYSSFKMEAIYFLGIVVLIAAMMFTKQSRYFAYIFMLSAFVFVFSKSTGMLPGYQLSDLLSIFFYVLLLTSGILLFGIIKNWLSDKERMGNNSMQIQPNIQQQPNHQQISLEADEENDGLDELEEVNEDQPVFEKVDNFVLYHNLGDGVDKVLKYL